MTAKRDSLFPSASVGRAQGTHIVRSPSRESLVVHPLLNTNTSSQPVEYVPYTPRQRQPVTATPPAPPASSQGTAPASAKLQLASLRAAAQTIGLDANSIGWAILEKISYEGDTSDGWSEIWNTLTKARVCPVL